ncbi:MAG: recombinase family protein [Blautia sp.]|nr:recombinase family protein [Blautia sp.]MCM1202482.1 recombinase family protein [Bacteroides fragilis]
MSAGSLTIAKYLRISDGDRDRQEAGKAESNSIANQRNLLSDFISRMPEFEDAEMIEFCDDGFSGKNFERPAVGEMLERVKHGEIQCIIVKDLSRFGRDYLTVGNYISRVFPFLGVRFIAVNDGFDSIRPMDADGLEVSFKTLLYDFYSRDLSQKVRGAQRFKAQRGEYISAFAPYGYVKDPGNRNHLAIDEKAAENVRRIFHLAADGAGTMEIARILNEEQVPTPMRYKKAAGCSRTKWNCIREDNFWTHEAVAIILRDERYVGRSVFGKRRAAEVGSFRSVKVSRKDWIIVDNTHEKIVTQEEFDRAQARIRRLVERGPMKSGGKNSLSGKKIRCGVCGRAMTRMRGRHPYYFCCTPRMTDIYSCPEQRIPEADLVEAVLDGLRAQVHYAVEISHIREEVRRCEKCGEDIIRRKLSELEESHAGLENSIRELYEKLAFGELRKTEYLSAKKADEEKRDSIAVKKKALEARLKSADAGPENRFTDSFRQYADIEELTAEIVPDVLQEVIVYPNKALHIVWNCKDDLEQILPDVDMEKNADKIF